MNDLIVQVRYDSYVPSLLKNTPNWVLWKLESGKNGKLTKVPKKPGVLPLSNASKTNSDHWNDYDFTMDRFKSLQGTKYEVNGLGIVLTESMNVVFVDIDHCIDPDTRQLDERGKEFLQLFPDTYCELSQSGTGLHFFVTGHIPRAFNNRDVHIEMYADKAYCAFTHNAIQPYELTDHQKELDFAFNKYKTADRQHKRTFQAAVTHPIRFDSDQSVLDKAMQNIKFADLYAGKWKELGYPSQSEAELSLCTKLAFWCERDPEAVDRIFRSSALYRSKWDERHGEMTYGEMTVTKACSELQESFTEWKRKRDDEFRNCILSKW